LDWLAAHGSWIHACVHPLFEEFYLRQLFRLSPFLLILLTDASAEKLASGIAEAAGFFAPKLFGERGQNAFSPGVISG
jgi:hypothetical protein